MMRANDTSTVCNNVQLNDFQCGPAHWLITHPDQKGVLCCYGTGYGKSLTAIATISALLEAGVITHCVVVTPLSLKDNMAKEFATCGNGPAVALAQAQTQILHYQMCEKHGMDAVGKPGPNSRCLLVVDEAHNLKNGTMDATSDINQQVTAMARRASKVLLLTGTPMPNYPWDIVPLLRMVDPERVKAVVQAVGEGENLLPKLATLAKHLVAFPGKDLTADFPEEKRINVYVPLDPDQQEALDKLDVKQRSSAGKALLMKVYLSKPRQHSLWLDPVRPSAKIQALAEHLRTTKARPALVFTEFTTAVVDIIQNAIVNASKGLKVAVLTGKTKAADRQKLVNSMNNGDLHVMILSSAGAEGLDFKKVREVHLLSPDWTSGEVDQKVGRAVRFRSHKDLPPAQRNVTVYRYVSVPVGEDAIAYMNWKGPGEPPIKVTKQVAPDVWEVVSVPSGKYKSLPSRYVELYLMRLEAAKRDAVADAMKTVLAVSIPQACYNLVPKKKGEKASAKTKLSICSAMSQPVKVGTVFEALNGYRYVAVAGPKGVRKWVRLNKDGQPSKQRTPGRVHRIPSMCAAATSVDPKLKEGDRYEGLNGVTYEVYAGTARDGSKMLRFRKAQ